MTTSHSEPTITTMQEILGLLNIGPRQVDLIHTIRGMESDKKRIEKVVLHHGTLPEFNLWTEVYIKQPFRDPSEFAKYIEMNGIYHDEFDVQRVADGESHNGTYILNSRGVRVEFKLSVQRYSK